MALVIGVPKHSIRRARGREIMRNSCYDRVYSNKFQYVVPLIDEKRSFSSIQPGAYSCLPKAPQTLR